MVHNMSNTSKEREQRPSLAAESNLPAILCSTLAGHFASEFLHSLPCLIPLSAATPATTATQHPLLNQLLLDLGVHGLVVKGNLIPFADVVNCLHENKQQGAAVKTLSAFAIAYVDSPASRTATRQERVDGPSLMIFKYRVPHTIACSPPSKQGQQQQL